MCVTVGLFDGVGWVSRVSRVTVATLGREWFYDLASLLGWNAVKLLLGRRNDCRR